MARRKQKSCHPCRNRHLKCDGEQPCMNCRRAVRECSKDSDHIFLNESNLGIVRRRKRYSFTYKRDQTWIGLPAALKFADAHDSESSGTESALATTSAPGDPGRSDSPLSNLDWSSQSCVPTDPRFQETYSEIHIPFETDLVPNDELFDGWFKPEFFSSAAQWPFNNYQEALLMRHFTQEIAPSFDYLDGATHFRLTIPELAADSPPLLNAIFAMSAKHLSLQGKMDESVSLRYTDACYQALMPAISEKAFEVDYLAAVLILRFVLQMTESIGVDEGGIAFLGLEVFLSAWKANVHSALHAELFFTVLRMYMHVSWLRKQPLREAEDERPWVIDAVSRLYGPARVENIKMVIHSAQAVNFAHRTRPKTWEEWLRLKHISDSWPIEKPKCFNPVFSQPADSDNPFPTLVFANDLHASTYQSYCLARIQVINNQPPTPPPPHLNLTVLTQQQREDETALMVRQVVGTALSNRQSALVSAAAPAITYGGHLLRDRLSQELAYALLQKGHAQCAGCAPAHEMLALRGIWGWGEEG